MGKLVVTEFVSIDGVFEDPGGSENYEHGGWTFEYNRGEDGDKFKMDELMDADVQLLGRRTYDGFAEAWPSREGPFADKINNGPKYVVSNTLTDPQWHNTTVISGDPVEGVVEAQGRHRRDDHRRWERHPRAGSARGGFGGRAPADGLPDDPRARPAPVPRRHRQAQVHARREQNRWIGRRPSPGLHAGPLEIKA